MVVRLLGEGLLVECQEGFPIDWVKVGCATSNCYPAFPPIPFVRIWVLDARDGLDLVVGLGSAWGRVLAQCLARC